LMLERNPVKNSSKRGCLKSNKNADFANFRKSQISSFQQYTAM
jgi:hypothetical protein